MTFLSDPNHGDNNPAIVGSGSFFQPSACGGAWCPICLKEGKYNWITSVTVGEKRACFGVDGLKDPREYVFTEEELIRQKKAGLI